MLPKPTVLPPIDKHVKFDESEAEEVKAIQDELQEKDPEPEQAETGSLLRVLKKRTCPFCLRVEIDVLQLDPTSGCGHFYCGFCLL